MSDLTVAQAGELQLLQRDPEWPYWPYLPLKRREDRGAATLMALDLQSRRYVFIPLNYWHLNDEDRYAPAWESRREFSSEELEQLVKEGWEAD